MQAWSVVSVRARGVALLGLFQVGSGVQGFSTPGYLLGPLPGALHADVLWSAGFEFAIGEMTECLEPIVFNFCCADAFRPCS
jgi:hypothetical protein